MNFKCENCNREKILPDDLVVYMCPCGEIVKIKKEDGNDGN